MTAEDDDGLQMLACEGKCRDVTEHLNLKCKACGHTRSKPPENLAARAAGKQRRGRPPGKRPALVGLRDRGTDLGPGGVPRERERAVRRAVKPRAAGGDFMPRKGNLLEQAVQKVLADQPPALTREDVEGIVKEMLGLDSAPKKRRGRPPKEASAA